MVPLSILDLAAVGREETIAESFAGSVELARAAEAGGYTRVWYAEHHGIDSLVMEGALRVASRLGFRRGEPRRTTAGRVRRGSPRRTTTRFSRR